MTYRVSGISDIKLFNGKKELGLDTKQKSALRDALPSRINKLIKTSLFLNKIQEHLPSDPNQQVRLKIRITGNDVTITPRGRTAIHYFVNPSLDSDITDEGDVREGDVQKAGMVNQKILKKVNDIYWGNRISAGQEEPIGRRLTKKENRGESSNSPSNTARRSLRGRSASSFSSRDPSPVRMEFNNDMADFFDHSNEEETLTDRDLTNVKELQELTTLNERLEQKVKTLESNLDTYRQFEVQDQKFIDELTQKKTQASKQIEDLEEKIEDLEDKIYEVNSQEMQATSELRQLQDKKEGSKEQIENLQNRIKYLETQHEVLKDEKDQVHAKNEKLISEHQGLQTQISELENEKNRTTARIKEMQGSVQEGVQQITLLKGELELEKVLGRSYFEELEKVNTQIILQKNELQKLEELKTKTDLDFKIEQVSNRKSEAENKKLQEQIEDLKRKNKMFTKQQDTVARALSTLDYEDVRTIQQDNKQSAEDFLNELHDKGNYLLSMPKEEKNRAEKQLNLETQNSTQSQINIDSPRKKMFSSNGFETEVKKPEGDNDLEIENISETESSINAEIAKLKAEISSRETQNTLSESNTKILMEDPSSEKTIEENKRQLELEIELQKQQLAQMSAPKQNSSNFIGINEVLADQLRDMTSERNTLLRQRELWAKKDRIVDAQLHFKVFKALVKERKAKIDQMQKAGVHIHLEDQLILNLDQMTDERNEAVSKLTELQKELAENELLIGLLEEEISELKKQLEAFTGHTITQEGNHTNPVSEINPQVVQEQAEDENQQEKGVSPTTENFKQRAMQNKSYTSSSRTELESALNKNRADEALAAEQLRANQRRNKINPDAKRLISAPVLDKINHFNQRVQ
ncbi:MAG: hypothetical protein WA347_07535 [Rhabdochlamydiaceae bacterium]